ncbi:hypothetical protein PR001_g11804 [Phytophthora rubi]|uniref:Uncharacterized protein n=1 Tax=Phytophthora rubi TaxID=129364 RepID=A0A6A3M822_9STRA|nr:hypothetical protein PR002_g11992 [Phytophthora rubi]KAE9028149.1 hypothetical protein PR001_g11804 [Phytophthora rubi]
MSCFTAVASATCAGMPAHLVGLCKPYNALNFLRRLSISRSGQWSYLDASWRAATASHMSLSWAKPS